MSTTLNPHVCGEPWNRSAPADLIVATIVDQCDFDARLRSRVFIGSRASERAGQWFEQELPKLTKRWILDNPDTPMNYFGPHLHKEGWEGDWG